MQTVRALAFALIAVAMTTFALPAAAADLETGWSVYVSAEDETVQDFVAENRCVWSVWQYVDGQWFSYFATPGVPADLQTLTALQAGEAYWVFNAYCDYVPNA